MLMSCIAVLLAIGCMLLWSLSAHSYLVLHIPIGLRERTLYGKSKLCCKGHKLHAIEWQAIICVDLGQNSFYKKDVY